MITLSDPTVLTRENREKLSFQLATWLLKCNKKVTFSELEALPTVESRAEVEEIIDFLTSHFDTEKTTVKTASWPMLSWETVIKLKDFGSPILTSH
jgi:hypothetical protein